MALLLYLLSALMMTIIKMKRGRRGIRVTGWHRRGGRRRNEPVVVRSGIKGGGTYNDISLQAYMLVS